MGFIPEDWLEWMKSSWQPYLEKKMIIKPHEPTLKERISAAHREWEGARNYFDNVSEPELVDYAAYQLQAAERKYVYLLKQAREKRPEQSVLDDKLE